ncbi:MAG: HAMP domain-containing histidine kinase [Erysipelothrix sp.]|nr:HAMP domain-containing histidine kinase [Erysipelothrix sp.]
MNKSREKLFRLSLAQQLIGIILLFVVVFLSFFFTYLNNNINEFVSIEMESYLASSQDSIIEAYQMNGNGDFLVNFKDDEEVSHKIWDINGEYQTETYRYLPASIRNQINLQRQQQMIHENYAAIVEISDNSSSFVVEITIKPESNVTYVTTISKDYSLALRNRLINSVVNAVLLIVFLLFAVMLMWVSSIIRSLSKIQDYVNKITKDEDATLEIDRQDELGEVSKALVYMNEELKTQERIKAELIQNISHDLKTPIATIKSYGESIKDGIYPYDTLEKSVDVIIEHATRLEQKVHSLLLLNRMDYLVANNDTEELALKEIIEKTIMSVIPISSNLEVITELEDVMFVGEEESWRVVCENILDNALRYAQTYIKIELSENKLTISNDGIHLTDAVKQTMFKPYEKGTDGGFGMGLSIVLRVVGAYGYVVDAENTEDGVMITIEK